MAVKRRSSRQDAIRWIVRNKSIRTQRSLVEELRKEGYNCTQATASRDITDMGLRKLREGVYVLAEDLHLQRLVSEFVTGVESVDNLTVIKAQPGTAPGIATALDSADLPDMVGTVAGNDSVLVISRSKEGSSVVERLIDKLRNVSPDQEGESSEEGQEEGA